MTLDTLSMQLNTSLSQTLSLNATHGVLLAA